MKLKFALLSLLLLFITVCSESTYAADIKLQKPISNNTYSFSGDNQTQTTGKILEQPLRVLVTDKDDNPIANHKLVFTIISSPKDSEGQRIDKVIVSTDSTGIAINYFQIGDKKGSYEIMVSSDEDCSANVLIYREKARGKSWIFLLIIGLIGGLALFLYGMEMLSKGMQAVAGNKMRNIISKFTKNRLLGLSAGLIVTVLIQSSSATSVMLVGFVEAQLMSFSQSLAMLLGAGIGTTVTAQLIAFKITDYALLIVAIGFGFIVFTKKSKYQNTGKAILGFGLLFFGMYIMSQAMYPLRTYDGFINLLIKLENPIIGIFVGFLFTALIQSSSAFLGIMITIASQGFLSIEACIPLILGTNLGTGVTAILASLNSGREAQRVAFAHTFFKLIGVLIFVWWIPDFAEFIKSISPSPVNEANDIDTIGKYLPRQIANAHTIFSIGLAVIILPFLNFFDKIIVKIMPVKELVQEQEFKLKYINSAISSTPVIALSIAKKETERMSIKVQKLIGLSLKPFLENDKDILLKWQELENETDFLKENINNYILSVSSENSDQELLNSAFQIMYVAKELEMIADIVNTNMRGKTKKWFNGNLTFSKNGREELETMQLKALKQISRSMELFVDINLEKVEHVKQKFKKYAKLAEEYEKQHYERLINNNEDSIGSSEVHLELLSLLKAINRHATNISRILIRWNSEKSV